MNEKPETCEINEEDLRTALSEMKTFMDITVEDLMKIYSLALGNAKVRLAHKVPVSAVMKRNVVTIGPGADLHAATRLLTENKVSGLPVVDEENRVIGLISEADVIAMAGVGPAHTLKDIIKHILGEPVHRHGQGTEVSAFMTSPAITIKPDADMRDAARVLDEKRIKMLPVVDGENRLVGIIARADIVRAMAKR